MPKLKKQSADLRRRLSRKRMKEFRQKEKANAMMRSEISIVVHDKFKQPRDVCNKMNHRRMEEPHLQTQSVQRSETEVMKYRIQTHETEEQQLQYNTHGQLDEIVQLYILQLSAPTIGYENRTF